jgi:hypothetical protein
VSRSAGESVREAESTATWRLSRTSRTHGDLETVTDLTVSRREREREEANRGNGGELEELSCWRRKIEMEREGLLEAENLGCWRRKIEMERGAAEWRERGCWSRKIWAAGGGKPKWKEGLLESGGGKSEMGKWVGES